MKDIKEITNAIFCGDNQAILKDFPAESVDCCITSPPYYGLRDYGVVGQVGNEDDYKDYLSRLWDIFDGVKTTLKSTGTLWVNLGDTYSGGGGGNYGNGLSNRVEGQHLTNVRNKPAFVKQSGLKPKCLYMIPERFAIGMIDRGWILRNVIIWHKPNCMPASVTDRFTVDYEFVYFFAKQGDYYFEQIIEDYAEGTIPRMNRGVNENKWTNGAAGQTPHTISQPRPNRKKERMPPIGGYKHQANGNPTYSGNTPEWGIGRNKRCVWKVSTKPFPGSHFAVFPPDLIEPMVTAGSPPGGIVLDPFMGSGTTCMVAKRLGRAYCGIDLKPEYVEMAKQRIASIPECLDSYENDAPRP